MGSDSLGVDAVQQLPPVGAVNLRHVGSTAPTVIAANAAVENNHWICLLEDNLNVTQPYQMVSWATLRRSMDKTAMMELSTSSTHRTAEMVPSNRRAVVPLLCPSHMGKEAT